MLEANDVTVSSLVSWAHSRRTKLLFVSHAWGGGVERHVGELIDLVRSTHDVMVLRGCTASEVDIEWTGASSGLSGKTKVGGFDAGSAQSWINALTQLSFARVHVHHIQGFSPFVLDLVEQLNLPIDVTLHDYFSICPQYQLNDATGRYCGEPDRDGCRRCLSVRPHTWALDIDSWRGRFGRFLLQADRVIAPSHDIADRFARYFPNVGVVVQAHPRKPVALQTVQKIALIGSLSKTKGLDVAVAVSEAALKIAPELSFRLIGHSAEPLPSSISFTGSYHDVELPRLMAEERPDAIWLPSQVPESFGYALSFALETELPIVASKIGAYAERLANVSHATLVDCDATSEQWISALRLAASGRARREPVRHANPEEFAAYRVFYIDVDTKETTAIPVPSANASPLLNLIESCRSTSFLVQKRPIVSVFRVGAYGGHRESVAEVERHLARLPAGEFGVVGRNEHDTQVNKLNTTLESEVRKIEKLVIRVDELSFAIQSQETRAQQQLQIFEDQARAARNHIAHLERERVSLLLEKTKMLDSLSWRITKPLRYARHTLRVAVRTVSRFTSLAMRTPNLSQRVLWLYRRGGGTALKNRLLQEHRRPADALTAIRAVASADVDQGLKISELHLLTSLHPTVSIIIPVFGQHAITFACLKSIAQYPPSVNYEVVIADDASTELAESALAPVTGVRIIRNKVNLGFIGNANEGAAAARGDYLVILNNDTVVTVGAFDAMLNTFHQHANVGLVGAKLLNRDGSLQEAGGIIWRDGSGWNWGRNEDANDPRFNYVRDVDYCSGAALAVRRDLFLEMGGFDSYYAPAYYEDTDLAFRMRQRGLRVIYQPAAQILHLEGVSHGRDESSGVKAYQAVNAQKFLERWQSVLAGHAENGVNAEREAHRTTKGNVLIVEAAMLTPDQDSGSIRMLNIMRVLKSEGYHVTFVGENIEFIERYVFQLSQLGIETLFAPYIKNVRDVLRKYGDRLDFIVFCRYYVAINYVRFARAHAPRAKVIFDTVDLHFLREEREAQLLSDAGKLRLADDIKKQELATIQACDTTLVVSAFEKSLLEELVPGCTVEVVSNVHELLSEDQVFEGREGMVFVGGFRHTPNVDAMLWYAKEVVPHLRKLMPGIKTRVIGSNMPDEIRALSNDMLEIVGFVEDTAPYLKRARLSVAPLRYGAGVKGKINEAMNHGLPVVATACAVEGMHLESGREVLVADDPLAFAQSIMKVHSDAQLWSLLSKAGRANVASHFSEDAVRPALNRVFRLEHD
jgi:O-antigen biosynthesis protein